ncbi:MAG: GlsB/YeaQ/YmgE family stress response membrane protein, partial [bacterium]|nr:GlsB/YeaQ/YmgE family stress response membrane protein [bacterium]
MHVIIWLIIGLIAGALARMIVPSAVGGGWITDLVVGVIGAFIGGWVVSLFGLTHGGFIWSIIVAIIGAVIL